MNLDANRHTVVVHHKLIGFADFEPRVIVTAPCDEDLSQLPVLLCKNSLQAKMAIKYILNLLFFFNSLKVII